MFSGTKTVYAVDYVMYGDMPMSTVLDTVEDVVALLAKYNVTDVRKRVTTWFDDRWSMSDDVRLSEDERRMLGVESCAFCPNTVYGASDEYETPCLECAAAYEESDTFW